MFRIRDNFLDPRQFTRDQRQFTRDTRHVYDLTVDALTLLGNFVYEFSMKRREMLKSEVAPAYKSVSRVTANYYDVVWR